jgi:7-cyano-7-deazaguanine synthase
MKRAVILLSGGVDSTTCLAIAKAEGFEPYALTFRYGQRHSVELDAAQRVAQALGVTQHVIADIDLRVFGGSALTADIAVPKGRDTGEMDQGIPITYVPARNTIFLSFALAWAEVLDSSDLFIGVNAIDYSGYPDCRPEFIESFRRTAALALRAGVEGSPVAIITPLIDMSKADIVRRGVELDAPLNLTWSCYRGNDEPCGDCDSCVLRAKGFAEANVADPALS